MLGIEHPQGVAVDAVLGIGIEIRSVLLQPGHQLLAVASPILRAAEGIELQRQTAHAKLS